MRYHCDLLDDSQSSNRSWLCSIAKKLERVHDVGLHPAALHHRVQEAMRQQKSAALDSDFTYLPLKQAVAPDTMKAAW